MGHLQETLGQAKLVHQLQRRGMDGVAAKVAIKVAVSFEHRDVHTLPRQQQAEHDPRWPATYDATLRFFRVAHLFRSHVLLSRVYLLQRFPPNDGGETQEMKCFGYRGRSMVDTRRPNLAALRMRIATAGC